MYVFKSAIDVFSAVNHATDVKINFTDNIDNSCAYMHLIFEN